MGGGVLVSVETFFVRQNPALVVNLSCHAIPQRLAWVCVKIRSAGRGVLRLVLWLRQGSGPSLAPVYAKPEQTT